MAKPAKSTNPSRRNRKRSGITGWSSRSMQTRLEAERRRLEAERQRQK